MNFINKVVLVTGASSGIGAATALKFAANGANVALVGRNKNKLNAVHKKIEEVGKKAHIVVADITKHKDAKSIVTGTIAHFGKLDVLVNNAGIVGFASILSDNAMETYDHIMATNLRAAIEITRFAAKDLIQTKGNIVNISSIGAMGVLHPQNFAYCTSKAGLDHFTKCVAVELSKYGIRVNSVNPGPVKTGFMDTMGIEGNEQRKILDSLANATILGKVSDPEEVADLVVFLASELAKSVTGSSYVVDNGMLLKSSLVL